MIYDGTITKPSLDELYHEKAHKYIERHKGPKGNWIYTYRKKSDNVKEKVKKHIDSEDPYGGMGVEGRFAVKAGVKLTKLALKGADRTKKAIKRIKHNSRYGKYSKSRRV